MTYETLIAVMVRHGMAADDVRGYIEDHGAARVWLWLRTCKRCRGKHPKALTCKGDDVASEGNPV